MEFNRSMQSSAPARPAASSAPAASTGSSKRGWKGSPMWLRVVWMVLLFAVTGLVVAMLLLFHYGGPKESNYIDKGKQQAVFLTNGQVYFGHVKTINKQYIDLQNIYYLNVNQQVQPNQTGNANSAANQSVSLVKLGCELHGPTDEMVINRDQVTFWENLKGDGQVSKAIAQWVQQNPNGQQCSTSSSSNSTTK